MTAIFGKAFSWLQEKMKVLVDWMPDWAKAELGMSSPALTAPVLTPSPSAVAAGQGGRSVAVDQKTDINIYTSADPQAVGQAVAGRQTDVNAQVIRHTVGAVQ